MAQFSVQMKTHSREDVTALVTTPLNKCLVHKRTPTILKMVVGKRKDVNYIATCDRDTCSKISTEMEDVAKVWNKFNPASGKKPELLSSTQWEVIQLMAVNKYRLFHRPANKVEWQLARSESHNGFGYKESSVKRLIDLHLIERKVINAMLAEYIITKEGHVFLEREGIGGK